jgi:MurNAc alpha-1-phosphate uridylyltransferase|tara:strand:+ start:566 stop:1255 length:690 start_codon:yes stop_codon:yes gene_type:complete
MKINTALILCAGYGKRLNPITLKIPKPLIEINEITLLENSINFLEKLEIENIKINTYYLHNQIQDFILNYKSNSKIEILNDGNEILDTGGGILNLINRSDENDFIVLNPDTVWGDNYLKTTINMMDYYFQKKVKNLLMIVNKENSFDERMRGDFSLSNEKLLKNKENNFIYTGLQIINKSLFKNEKVMSFSVTKIWDEAIKNKMLYGFESKEQFIHLTDLEIYNKLVKK